MQRADGSSNSDGGNDDGMPRKSSREALSIDSSSGSSSKTNRNKRVENTSDDPGRQTPQENERTATQTSPSSLTANAAPSLVVTDTIRRPQSAAVLRATHRPRKGLVLPSSSGSTWLSWLSVATSSSSNFSTIELPSPPFVGSFPWETEVDEETGWREGRGGTRGGWGVLGARGGGVMVGTVALIELLVAAVRSL